MNQKPIPQLGAVMALAQLLQEFPDLPTATWSIDQYTGDLSGYLHDAGMSDLDAYAQTLGGAVRPGRDYVYQGQLVRPHRLSAKWRDVEVTVAVVLPAPVPVSLERAA
ncbi:hypothetical protein [Streptomyces sp. A1136]|uniref:hypothetical protein n=1 Tax=Streptomyces sp. A1136 TaxID=2563102 RepID=UPI00109EA342|nr:hypothetical protein [Streptomyces sp. A1136]THA56144.1 hypothetical protein E6R62_12430 [Streptomyces sp. A1136]